MKDRRRQSYIITAVALAAVVAILDIMFIAAGDRAYSPTENRNLQQFPMPDAKSALSGRFESRFEDYVADQFPLRDQWIGVKSTVDRLLGRTDANGVFLGGDGFLIRDFTAPDAEAYDSTLAAIRDFSARHSAQRQYMLLAPSAVTIYANMLPANAPAGDESGYIDRMRADLSGSPISFVDVRDALKRLAQQYQLYYRTDHHWTTDGAYIAYKELAWTAGLTGAPGGYDRAMLTDGFSGTLTASSGFRMSETDAIYAYVPRTDTEYAVNYVAEGARSASVYKTENLELRDKYTVFLNGNHPQIRIETASPSARTLLVLKDSYANCFIPFLIPDFQRIVIIDPRYYTGDLELTMEVEGITDILYLYNAETLATDTALKADLN